MRLRAFASNPVCSKMVDKLKATSQEDIKKPFSLLGKLPMAQ